MKDGRVQRKNRAAQTSNFWNTPQEFPRIEKERPGPGHRHVLLRRDVERFISILPDWPELSKGLNAVLLAENHPSADGWHAPGVVAICAWPRDLWLDAEDWYYEEHRDLFARLGVPYERAGKSLRCRFTEDQVKAFQLLHILLHELGHHHDRMTTRTKRQSARGEGYAEQYARNNESLIWNRYLKAFELY